MLLIILPHDHRPSVQKKGHVVDCSQSPVPQKTQNSCRPVGRSLVVIVGSYWIVSWSSCVHNQQEQHEGNGRQCDNQNTILFPSREFDKFLRLSRDQIQIVVGVFQVIFHFVQHLILKAQFFVDLQRHFSQSIGALTQHLEALVLLLH